MKSTCACPKCGGPVYTIPHGYTYGPSSRLNFKKFAQILLDAYICGKCGYTEQYVKNQEYLDKILENWKKV